MARILLISTNTTTEPYPVYPIGMSIVAAALTEAGHDVMQFDFLMAESDMVRLAETVTAFKPDMTGISLRNIDNVDSLSSGHNWYLAHVRDVVGSLKEAGQTVIVGGPGFSLMAEDILDYLGADHGVIGEGESKMVRLIPMIEKGDAPRIMRQEKGLPPDRMLTPLWDEDILEFYMNQSGIMNIQTKRGCANRCSYCSYPSIEGGTIRPRDAEAVADEIEDLHARFDVRFLFFTDSVFNDDDGHYLEVAEALAQKALPLKWSAFFQPTAITRDEVRLLKRAGMHAMEVGTDASTDTTLRAMNKPFLFEDVELFQTTCATETVPCAHFVIFGGPGETMETIRTGVENLNRLESCVVFPFSGIRLHSGTPLYRQAVREGSVTPETSLLEPYYYFSPDIDPEAMNRVLEQTFGGRRDRLFPPSEGQDRMNILRRFGYRGLLWDTLIAFGNNAPRRRTRSAAR